MLRALTGLLLTLLSGLVLAQPPPEPGANELRLDFGSPGPRVAWVGPRDRFPMPQGAKRSEGATLQLSFDPATAKTDWVYVHDVASGGLAGRPLGEVAVTGWKLAPKDWARLYEVNVRVESRGKPVANASLRARVGGTEQTRLIVPGSNGRATFYGLPAGQLKLEAVYLADGETRTSPTRSYEIKPGSGPPGFILTIDDNVMTIGADPDAKTPAPADEVKPAQEAPRGTAAQTWLSLLIGLAVVAGAGYAAYRYWKRDPQAVQGALQKLGIGDPNSTAGPAAAVSTAPKAPDPLKPIVLPDATPAPAVTPLTTGAVRGEPRLVPEGGAPIAVPDGECLIGREEGLTFSVVGETSVSRRHASLVRQGTEVTLRDLGSTNGTYLNGARLGEAAVLNPGDTIQCGARRFRYEVG